MFVDPEASAKLRYPRERKSPPREILGHGGMVLNSLADALARLGTARAYAAQHDTAKAKTAYLDFLNF